MLLIALLAAVYGTQPTSSTKTPTSPTSSPDASPRSSFGDLSPFGECFDKFTPTFVRTVGTRQARSSSFVAKVDMVTCANHCRQNYDPSTDQNLPCVGFNFYAGRNPTCEFFAEASVNSTAALKTEATPTFYFEKTCLRSPTRCEESAFLLDVRRGFRLVDVDVDERGVDSVTSCMEACILREICGIYKTTRRDAQVVRDVGFDYYENNCLHPSSRCSSGRVEFFVSRRSDVPSFGVSVGVKSVRNCVQACIQNTHFFCRSAQFDPISNECFVSDESSDVAVPSPSLDLYEPFCVPANVESTCNRPYVFEKFITTKIKNVASLRQITKISVESCLKACLEQVNCRSANYNVLERVCILFDAARTDGGTTESDENYDFFEAACPMKIASSLPSTTSEYVLVAAGTTLRQEFRQLQHVGTSDVNDCWNFCATATFQCVTFAFSESQRQCILSSFKVTNSTSNMERFTQLNKSFDLFAMATMGDENVTFPTLSTNDILIVSDNEFMASNVTSTLQPPKTGKKSRAHSQPSELLRGQETSSLLPLDPELVALSAEKPRVLPVSTRIGYAPPQLLAVVAECHPSGINVTFDLPHDLKYTGVVYAAERFEQCRVFVKNSSTFAIFIPRPEHNTWCNALEVDGEMSSILVVSNDRVLPHDVTTKDDLFYQVSCHYSNNDEGRHDGAVVGGPLSAAMAGEASPQSTSTLLPMAPKEKLSLEITRDGNVVESVFLGEQLVATVKSNISAENLRVVDCTAYSVGGEEPPASVHLIQDGCALIPTIMSPMRLTSKGWQSSLSAFRIDGSEQIDVVCLLAVCSSDACPKMKCSPAKVARRQRTAKFVIKRDTNAIRVDRRLVVKSDTTSTSTSPSAFPQVCMEPSTYLPALGLFLASLVALGISIVLTLRRSSRQDSRVEQLLSSPLPTEDGPKYIKTISL